jgi:intracellular septation protein
MTITPQNPWLKASLEFGPVLGFVVAYMIHGNRAFLISGIEYSGFVAVTAAFIPVFTVAIVGLWLLSGRVSRVQLAVAAMVLVFGGLSVWLNDPSLFKMKPTVIYLLLALILGVGLLRGQSWLKYVAEDMIPLTPTGWMILTKRVTVVFFLSAALNELVWRTQSEIFWVLFETFAMPLMILVFFLTQIGVFVDHATLNQSKKKRRPKKPLSRRAIKAEK